MIISIWRLYTFFYQQLCKVMKPNLDLNLFIVIVIRGKQQLRNKGGRLHAELKGRLLDGRGYYIQPAMSAGVGNDVQRIARIIQKAAPLPESLLKTRAAHNVSMY
jgi:hypothetical protein